MEKRRTRGRPLKDEKPKRQASPARNKNISPPTKRASPARTKVSPVRRASPARTKVSPVRRSSRPRSTPLGTIINVKTKTYPSPIKEIKEQEQSKKPSPSTRSNLPSTLTTTTSSRAPVKTVTTSSVHSSYSSSTQQTVEIRSSSSVDEKVVAKIKDYLRRSVSKTIGDTESNTEVDSRYSRSASRSIFADDKEYSDNEEKRSVIAEEDEEDEDHYKSFVSAKLRSETPSRRKLESPREFGGALGISLLLVLIPTVVYYLQWTCGKNSCVFKPLNLSLVWDAKYLIEKVFPTEAVVAYLSFNAILFILSGTVYGRRVRFVEEPSKESIKFNALPIAVLVTIAAAVAEYMKFGVADFIIRHYLRFCIYSLLNAISLAHWSYIRAGMQTNDFGCQKNPYAKTGNFLVDYGLGRQLNPKWLGSIDYKQAFYRVSLIATLLFAESFLYKKIQVPTVFPAELTTNNGTVEVVKYFVNNTHYDAGAVLAASFLLVYIIDAIVFEHHLVSSFELQGEGFGCLLLLRYAATPFLLSSVAKFFYERRMPAIGCKYAIIGGWTLLLLGIALKRLSSAVKYKYRTNPSSVHFDGIETIHTFQGRRLLLGALWGRLRQPNYAGDIIALIGLASPLFLRFSWPPLISISLLILVLLHRTVRVYERNISRYHSSWMRYCTRVPNFILPKVY